MSRNGLKVRRDKIEGIARSMNDHQGGIGIEKYKNDMGFYSIPSDIWRRLTRDDRETIKKFNGELRRKRERTTSNGKRFEESLNVSITQR